MEIELEVTAPQSGKAVIRLPVEIHVDSEGEVEFIAIAMSSWDNDSLDGPFDLVDFLIWAGFQHNDDCGGDSWETQLDSFREDIQRQVNEYFRGPKAALLALLGDAISWEARQYIKQLGIWEIRFERREEDAFSWKIELLDSDQASEPGSLRS